MPVTGFDHVVLPTADSERFIRFYKRLGFNIIGEEKWRNGEARNFAIQIGESKINVHPPELKGVMKGPTASPGCGDLCFVWEGTVRGVVRMLGEAGVEIVEGPVPRAGGRNSGRTMGTSVYVRDPDQNLLEFMVYD
jgi:catechol 2,3-dioxygenase-like lactoylglutathione lyase family enzyme